VVDKKTSEGEVMKRCEICNEPMPDGICAYWKVPDNGKGPGINAHIGCFESKISVLKIQSVSMGSFYYDDNLDNLGDMLAESELGDGYTVTKEEMSQGAFLTLPEFTGF
jgi:hypothetical protein